MSVFSMAGGNPALPTYPLQRSVRLRSSASAYFGRTPTTTTNQNLWTFSCWLKRGALTNQAVWSAGTAASSYSEFGFLGDKLYWYNLQGGVDKGQIYTASVLRDPSAWYHLVFVFNGTTPSVAFYVNGVQQTTTVTTAQAVASSYQNSNTAGHAIGRNNPNASLYFDGYLTEINFIDGQALTPSSFGAYNSYGVWSPAKYTGTYGTNGFYLNFQDNSALTTTANVGIGKDSSGNGNYWTSNNISITAGATYDSMLDVPTLTSATNSNYCTLNPLAMFGTGASASNGNLKLTVTTAGGNLRPTFGATSGKYYAEFTITNIGGNSGTNFAIQTSNSSVYEQPLFNAIYYVNGQTYNYSSSSFVSYGASYTTGDIIGVTWDVDNKQVTFYKNNVSQGTLSGAAITPPNAVAPVSVLASTAGGTSSTIVDVNFGQQPFTYTPPTGYNRLCTYNLPDSIVPVGAQYMAATLYTGNASTQTITNTVNGTSMQPDFVWTKSRTQAYNHQLYDSVRGATNWLQSNSTTANQTNATTLTSFNSNGFTVGANDNGNFTNGGTAVGWQWRASNASAVTNTNGALTSQVSVNQTAGFSIVTWTGTGTGATTVGHGLSTLPQFVIIKKRSTTGDWYVASYASGQGLNYGYHLFLNTAGALSGSNDPYYMGTQTSLTSNVLQLAAGNPNNGGNENGTTYVAYCWTPVPGFSKFGSYTGNGSANGPFVYTGFRPRWVMIKNTAVGTDSWQVWDTARNTYNVSQNHFYPNLANAETSGTGFYIDIISNGFKIRTTNSSSNASGNTIIYAAFAEHPFKYSLAR